MGAMNAPGTPAPAATPPPPYFAVIFTATRDAQPGDGFTETDERMFALAQEQPGFLGYDTTGGGDGLGITVSYWETEAAIAAWKATTEHVAAQREGRARWFDSYVVRVARVERAYDFTRSSR
jgi:heme-degrading monooxygenase HmoA